MARGDQIYVMRALAGLQSAYEHHGIDCGDGTVIHYSKRGEVPKVTQTTLAEFAGTGRVMVKHYATCYVPDATIVRAKSRLGEQKYSLLLNNCEHFATWCKTGQSVSVQVRDFLPFLETADPDWVDEALHQSVEEPNQQAQVQEILQRALAEIRPVWDGLQPQYNEAVDELRDWHEVAVLAMQQGKEEAARRAIARKLAAKQRAETLKADLDRLAEMTETLVRNASQTRG